MSTPKISVICPVYKAEKYLHRCVDSILAQTFTDFELLLIDDGSPDKSGEICDEYAAKDSRVRVFHKENGGVSSARNLGFNHIKGEWVVFVDSDDYVSNEYLNPLISACLSDKTCDFAYSNFKEQKTSSVDFIKNKDICYDSSLDCIVSMLRSSGFIKGPVCKIYKSEIIKNNNFSFDESLRNGEDFVFNVLYLSCCKKIKYVNGFSYYYVFNENSATRNIDNYLINCKDNFAGSVIIYNHLSEKDYFNSISKYVLSYLLKTKMYILFAEKDIVKWNRTYPECHKKEVFDLLNTYDKLSLKVLLKYQITFLAFNRCKFRYYIKKLKRLL